MDLIVIVENGDTGDANSAYANLPSDVVNELKMSIHFD